MTAKTAESLIVAICIIIGAGLFFVVSTAPNNGRSPQIMHMDQQ